MQRPKSIMEARDPEVLQTMLDFYAAPYARVVDVTANKRRMWNGVQWGSVPRFVDIDPAMNPDIVADFRDLPIEEKSVDVLIFDPPHLPAASASAASDKAFVERYGLSHAPKGDNISSYFAPFLLEAHRILSDDGLIFAKLKDFVHNHQYQWMLTAFISAVQMQKGLTPCDLIIKKDPSGGSMMSSKWENAHHVRNAHCYWIVVRKGRCERKANNAKR